MSDTPSPDGPRLPALVLLVVTSVGVPGTVVALFKEEVVEHPWLSLMVGLVWGVLVLVGALVTDTLKILRGRWTERLANWIDTKIQILVSRYRRRYLEFLYYQHRDFDVKGLSTHGPYNLELEHVFVDLSITARPAHVASTDPIRPMPEKLSGRRQIWDYLKSEALADDSLVLIGPPGSGKTTLLKKVALQLTGRHKGRQRLTHTLPVLLFLREHAEAIRNDTSYSLAGAVEAALVRKQGQAPPPGWFEEQLRAGRCLVLLDGLDEVAAAETRQKVVAWVEGQMKAYAKNRFVVSSRPYGYRNNPIAGVSRRNEGNG